MSVHETCVRMDKIESAAQKADGHGQRREGMEKLTKIMQASFMDDFSES